MKFESKTDLFNVRTSKRTARKVSREAASAYTVFRGELLSSRHSRGIHSPLLVYATMFPA